jgi:hypothetical protein
MQHRSELDSVGEREVEARAPTWTAPYPTHGQGVFIFTILRTRPFALVVNAGGSAQKLRLEIGCNKIQLQLLGEKTQLLAEVSEPGVGYDSSAVTSYWFSLNRDQMVVKYGKGYLMEETTLLTHDFLAGVSPQEENKRRCSLKSIFGPQACKTLELHDSFADNGYCAMHIHQGECLPSSAGEGFQGESHGSVQFFSSKQLQELDLSSDRYVEPVKEMISLTHQVEFYKHPLIVNWPFLVKDGSDASLYELDSNNYIFTGSLPTECQELYTNIASSKVDLDWAPTPQDFRLSDAIRYSFETKGKALHEKLKWKKMKYIRVTVGPHRSPSPGIPYVLELWPKSHGSPIHCHGDSYGVIKVLHGGLRAEIYSRDMKTLIKHYNIQKGDITWMSPFWYQCHRLFNDTQDFCATLQCYRYGAADVKMWPFFDYVNADGSHGEFLPNGDYTFTELHQTVLNEYASYMNTNNHS